MSRALVISVLLLPVLGVPGFAQGKVELKPRKGTLPTLERVMLPSANYIAIGETSNWLGFVHERAYPDAHVSLVRLDAKGKPAAYAVKIKLPAAPPGLVKHPSYALSVTFHPKLPLLYVWQDAAVPYYPFPPPTPIPPDVDKIDHLLVYDVSKETPELIASLCRGPEFVHGCKGGTVQIDAAGEYLYIPNMRDLKNRDFFRIGRFPLDETGLPRLEDKDGQLPPPARLKRLIELNSARPLLPPHVSPIENVYLLPGNDWGCGFGICPVAKDIVILGAWNGLVSWAVEDKRTNLSGLQLRVAGGNKFIQAHLRLPIVYATANNANAFFRVEHGEGYVSQLPTEYFLPEVGFFSRPAFPDKGTKVAIGSRYRIYVGDLDELGRCRPDVIEVPVFNPEIRALAYSERFDRLYVSEEIGK